MTKRQLTPPLTVIESHLRYILVEFLRQMGYSPNPRAHPRQLAIWLHKALRRQVPACPRVVHKAEDFEFPGALAKNVDRLAEEFRGGDDVAWRLSKRHESLGYRDALFDEWAIHHFHIEKHKQERRGPDVLFALVDPADVYFLRLGHKDHEHAFSAQNLIRIIYRNWRHLLEPYHLKGVIRPVVNLDDAGIATLRRASVNTMVMVEEGQIFGGMGGGFVLSGDNRLDSQWSLRLLVKIERLADEATRLGAKLGRDSSLVWRNRRFCIEKASGEVIVVLDWDPWGQDA